MPPQAILDPSQFPQAVVVDIEGIRQQLPQRFEMEQLTAITLLDAERKIVVGYKDVTDQEFWVRGHMPGFPLMPGVIMCEAAAQLCAFYCGYFKLYADDHFVAFGGMNDVRFRGSVRPGQRLWLVGKTEQHHNRRMQFEFQGVVEGSVVFHGQMLGIPIKRGAPGP
jgi:3-hydroxyacyl-[acyl-carrier-protein] dehydratase